MHGRCPHNFQDYHQHFWIESPGHTKARNSWSLQQSVLATLDDAEQCTLETWVVVALPCELGHSLKTILFASAKQDMFSSMFPAVNGHMHDMQEQDEGNVLRSESHQHHAAACDTSQYQPANLEIFVVEGRPSSAITQGVMQTTLGIFRGFLQFGQAAQGGYNTGPDVVLA